MDEHRLVGELPQNEILYAGYRFDAETGLYHVRNRMYHPTLGRWLQRDPKGYVDGMDLYEYCKSGPLNITDCMGLEVWVDPQVKVAFQQCYQKSLQRAANGLNQGGVTGAYEFASGLAEAVTNKFVGGVVETLDFGARQERVKADAKAEVQRRLATEPDASTAGVVAKSVAVAVTKNFPVADAVWHGAEAAVDKGLGGVTDGQKIFDNGVERIAAGCNAVSALAGIAAVGLDAAGVTPTLGGKAAQAAEGPKSGSEGGPGAGKRFSESTMDAARAESDNKCVFCGDKTTSVPGPKGSEIDHAIPKSRGGNNSGENAQNTCRTCNREKGPMTTEEYVKKKADADE